MHVIPQNFAPLRLCERNYVTQRRKGAKNLVYFEKLVKF